MSIGAELGMPPSRFSYKPALELVLPRANIGLEFEFEGVSVTLPRALPWVSYWESKKDGSLHDRGVEFVFAQPLFGQDALEATKGLCAFARENKFLTNVRTGLHVHVDVRDLRDRSELNRLVMLYALFEKAVYNFVGDNREDNVFCFPWYKAFQTMRNIGFLAAAANDGNSLAKRASAMHGEKYAGLNLDSLSRFGTVEFRHHLCTTDYERVLRWVNICLRFKEAAQRLTWDESEMLAQLSTLGVDEFSRLVLGAQYHDLVYTDLERDIWGECLNSAMDFVTIQQSSLDTFKGHKMTHGKHLGLSRWIDDNMKPSPEIVAPPRPPYDFAAYVENEPI